MSKLYATLSRLFPTRKPPTDAPKRVLLVRPCCIGDVVMATAALVALRRAYPDAHITWAVGGWSRQAVANHSMVNEILDTGEGASPLDTAGGFWRFVRAIRRGRYDVAVSLVRSPKMSAALWLSGVPIRAGIDSDGRGFGYNLRASIDPQTPRHETAIYRDVVAALGVDVGSVRPLIPLSASVRSAILQRLTADGIWGPFIVVNPSGGNNPGAQMATKRYPTQMLAETVMRLAVACDITHVVIVAGPDDKGLAGQLALYLRPRVPIQGYVGALSFEEIGALGSLALLYIGNDTGLTHYAAASGARTVMLLGPTDPARYGPDSPDALALWQPYPMPEGGFAAGPPAGWNWHEHGIQPAEAAAKIARFMRGYPPMI